MLPKPPDLRERRRYRFDIKRMTADCEANYVRLCSLLPGLDSADGNRGGYLCGDQRTLRIAEGGMQAALDMSVQELSRYTTMLDLHWAFDALASLEAFDAQTMRMQVRLYHDVRLAEVITMSGQRSAQASYEYPNAAMFQRDEKAQQNRLLAEWLCRCLRFGHAADSASDGSLALDVLRS
ncbi:MAG: DUF1249 domain-containing protein [Gammaproteobacteria bacterium]|nr:DUF1249 domain-containing protein [Gammaproteobacteria bacterium]NND40000.1 DUF1249 domain-containing protein [Pseudomonadales bacterium]MBT8151346.1 DUF1249 domain-containing protein [Gammaproteobacteria bacterium]NNL10399.1 DUF1249 domain-containing protein [Pseudomonadales bacterium]NNM12246.1 DUF1249 domain-containing protein [Pseudomonadales bacterium]